MERQNTQGLKARERERDKESNVGDRGRVGQCEMSRKLEMKQRERTLAEKNEC